MSPMLWWLTAAVCLSASSSESAGSVRCSDGLLIAARYGDVEQIRTSLLTEPVNCTDEDQQTPLHAAAAAGNAEGALELLAAGALMARDFWGRAPLHSATIAGKVELASLLLDSGAYVELQDTALRTPLHFAAREGHLELTRLLLGRGATLNMQDMNLRTPLHFSARGDELINVSKLLLERGAQIELGDAVGYRPLHVACKGNQRQTVDLLLERDADVYALDAAGWNPIVHASAQGNHELVNWLVVRQLKPKTFPLPDPEMFHERSFEQSILGMPAWLLASVLCGITVVAVVCPFCYFMQRYRKLFRIHTSARTTTDQDIEDFIDSLFDQVQAKEHSILDIARGWDSVPAFALKDLHRVRVR